MKRCAKQSRATKKIIEQALDELCIDEMPQVDCPLRYRSKYVPITECVGECWEPCIRFLGLRFVMDACMSENCSYEAPCLMCLERMEDMKVLIKVLNAVGISEQSLERNRRWAGKRRREGKRLRGSK